MNERTFGYTHKTVLKYLGELCGSIGSGVLCISFRSSY